MDGETLPEGGNQEVRREGGDNHTDSTVRRMASMEVCSPRDAWCHCRRCGGKAKTWHIVGLTAEGPRYWECVVCGMGEVVSGTPMMFGEVVILSVTKEELKKMYFNEYNEYRKRAYLPLITDEEWEDEHTCRPTT